MTFFPSDVFTCFKDDVKRIVENDFPGFEGHLEKELYRCRQLQQRGVAVSVEGQLPKKLSQLSEAQENCLVERVLLDWMHYIAVKVTPAKRQVRFSDDVAPRVQFSLTLMEIVWRLREGLPLWDRSSRKLHRKVNISQFTKDHLYWNFGITHLHLSRLFETPKTRAGGDEILYLFCDASDAVLLEIGKHDFSLRSTLLEKLGQAAPEILNRFELKGVVGLSVNISEAERTSLLKAGVSTPIPVKGKYYLGPGQGTASSCHALRIVKILGDLVHSI